jgi:hypothetical protein
LAGLACLNQTTHQHVSKTHPAHYTCNPTFQWGDNSLLPPKPQLENTPNQKKPYSKIAVWWGKITAHPHKEKQTKTAQEEQQQLKISVCCCSFREEEKHCHRKNFSTSKSSKKDPAKTIAKNI